MAFGTSAGDYTDAETLRLIREMQAFQNQKQAINQAQSLGTANVNGAGLGTYIGASTGGSLGTFTSTAQYANSLKSAIKKQFANTATEHPGKARKSREVSVSSVLRGINGLLYKIWEMKGKH